MATAARPEGAAPQEFGEKSFYLDEFRAHTLCIAARFEQCEPGGGFEALGEVIRELICNDSRVILLLGVPPSLADPKAEVGGVVRRLRRAVLDEETAKRFPPDRGRRGFGDSILDLTEGTSAGELSELLVRAWVLLRSRPLLVALLPAPELIDFAQSFAGRLRVHKLVIAESEGGICSASAGQISFMDEEMLNAVLRTGQAEWAGLAGRRQTLAAIRSALREGVGTVNLCSPDGIARELYTYEGSGTLFTREDYCRVERLGIDDFEEVERLIDRGQREGVLKPRTAAQTARILLNGFGATIGAHHLAGVCGLETEAYADEGAGEVVGLYTITRFKSEGIGRRLIDCLLAEARELGLRYVFACTVDPRAQAFFERQGFRQVSPDDVPASKWDVYDSGRLDRLKVFRRDVETADERR